MDNQQGATIQHTELCSMFCGSLDGKGTGEEWTHVYVQLSSLAVHLKASQHCLSQYKTKSLKKAKTNKMDVLKVPCSQVYSGLVNMLDVLTRVPGTQYVLIKGQLSFLSRSRSSLKLPQLLKLRAHPQKTCFIIFVFLFQLYRTVESAANLNINIKPSKHLHGLFFYL